MVCKENIVSLLIVTAFSFTVIGVLTWYFSPYRTFDKERLNLGVYQGSGNAGIAKDFFRVQTVQSFHELKKMWRALDRRQIDGVLADRLQGLAAISTENFLWIRPVGEVLNYQLQAVAFRGNDSILCQAVNQGLTKIIENQIFGEISKEYFGQNITAEVIGKMNSNGSLVHHDPWEQIQRKSHLKLAFPSDNPPFSYLNNHQKLIGFDVEIALAVCIQLGIRYFQPVAVTNRQMLSALEDKQIDGVWGVTIDPKMKSKVVYSNPYRVSGVQLFVRKDSPINSPEYLVPPVYPELPPGMGKALSNLSYR